MEGIRGKSGRGKVVGWYCGGTGHLICLVSERMGYCIVFKYMVLGYREVGVQVQVQLGGRLVVGPMVVGGMELRRFKISEIGIERKKRSS